jgi:GNAT superfamily N-acetyltransferase
VRLYAEDEIMRSQARAEAGTQAEADPVTDAHRAAFSAIENDPNNQLYVAEVGGDIVGSFQLTFIQQLSHGGSLVAQVESVFVAERARSLGVGTLMLELARKEAERRRALRIQLTSNVKRERAHRFYERLGYRATHKGMKLYLEPASRAGKAER